MDSISICWRGLAGVGKRSQLVKALQRVANDRGVPFSIQMRAESNLTSSDIIEGGTTEEGAGTDGYSGEFKHETSLVHIGLDVARMSMQDKNIIRPIITKIGQGSQVLSGNQGRARRIIVFYHAHLLSSESIILIHACLEQNDGDVSVWMTSELPVPQRIRDWFVEVPVIGEDYSFKLYRDVPGLTEKLANWPDIFRAIIDKWRSPPRLSDIRQVKSYVYEMLMRNLRWVEATHFILDVILDHEDITEKQRQEAVQVLSKCEATGGGFTIPSYRIPIIWEGLLVQLRTIFATPSVSKTPIDGAAGAKRTIKKRRTGLAKTASKVVAVGTDGGGGAASE